MKGQTRYLNKEVRQGVKWVINYYPRLSWRQGNDLLSPYFLISPLAHPKYAGCLFVHRPYWSHNDRIEQLKDKGQPLKKSIAKRRKHLDSKQRVKMPRERRQIDDGND
ncbi:MAG: hypothetical protein EZS28_020068 [Streblomastix strix]|uniref:Uncharacterized protein n=1 Tax=Streblomastix strix TaxID=222440 RepID=A0A5J4VPD6_9EUKA|nr:MAG: hypothetical protein EZS28_020068 [Streblomastix strix]